MIQRSWDSTISGIRLMGTGSQFTFRQTLQRFFMASGSSGCARSRQAILKMKVLQLMTQERHKADPKQSKSKKKIE